jgi:hypothetical protein
LPSLVTLATIRILLIHRRIPLANVAPASSPAGPFCSNEQLLGYRQSPLGRSPAPLKHLPRPDICGGIGKLRYNLPSSGSLPSSFLYAQSSDCNHKRWQAA